MFGVYVHVCYPMEAALHLNNNTIAVIVMAHNDNRCLQDDDSYHTLCRLCHLFFSVECRSSAIYLDNISQDNFALLIGRALHIACYNRGHSLSLALHSVHLGLPEDKFLLE